MPQPDPWQRWPGLHGVELLLHEQRLGPPLTTLHTHIVAPLDPLQEAELLSVLQLHCPLSQVKPLGHPWPQVPQFWLSVIVLVSHPLLLVVSQSA